MGDIDYIGQLEDDIEDLIVYSKKNFKSGKMILAGHSSGGGLVLRFIGNPERSHIDKAVMLAPYLGHTSPTVKANSGNWVTVAIKRWVGLSMLNRIGITSFNDLPVLFFNRPASYSDKLQAPFYSYRMAVNFAPDNYKKEIESIKNPCLVLIGAKDESFYPYEFNKVFEPADQYVETKIIESGNHLDIVSSNEAIGEVIGWLKR